MKRYVECLIYLSDKMILKEIKDAKKEQFIIWFPNTH